MDELPKKLICVEGGHEIVPEFAFEDGNDVGSIRCVVCGLIYLDSEDIEYSMKLIEELKQKNIKEVNK